MQWLAAIGVARGRFSLALSCFALEEPLSPCSAECKDDLEVIALRVNSRKHRKRPDTVHVCVCLCICLCVFVCIC